MHERTTFVKKNIKKIEIGTTKLTSDDGTEYLPESNP